MTFGYVLSERGEYGLKITDEKGEDESAEGWLDRVAEGRGFVGGLVELEGWWLVDRVTELGAELDEATSTKSSAKQSWGASC